MTPFLAHAEPITFTLTSATVNGVQFTPAQANGQWIQHKDIRVKFVANGMHDLVDPDSLGVFWAAMLTGFTTRQDYSIAVYGRLCVAGSCADIVTGGVVSTSPEGLRWTLPPPPQSYTGHDGQIISLSPVTNLPDRGVNATIDLNLKASVAPTVASVPEPASLLLLGSGLAGLAAGIRKRR